VKNGMTEATDGKPCRGQNRQAQFRAGTGNPQKPFMTSRESPQRTASKPSVQPNEVLQSQSQCDSVNALLVAHPASRTVLRHLVYFVAAYRKSGAAVFDSLRLDVLKQALLQLHLAAPDNPPANIRVLARQMGAAVARRSGLGGRPAHSDARPSDLMSGEQMMVSEGRMSDFVRLADKSAKPDG
jgi:hypothetical protein